MNYTIYYESHILPMTYNFINTIGDLQSIIINTINIPKESVLFISHDTNILGIQYPFTSNILQHQLYDVNLYVIMDYFNADNGTKNIYLNWLESQIDHNRVIESSRQLLYYDVLNSNFNNNLSFFLEMPFFNQHSHQSNTTMTSRHLHGDHHIPLAQTTAIMGVGTALAWSGGGRVCFAFGSYREGFGSLNIRASSCRHFFSSAVIH